MRGARCEDGDNKAKSRRGEHEVSRNPSRRESRVVSGYTCGPTPVLSTFCTGPMGAIGTRLSLCPLRDEGETRSKPRANHVARMRSCDSPAVPHIHRRPGEGRDPLPQMKIVARCRNDESRRQRPLRRMGPGLRRDDAGKKSRPTHVSSPADTFRG